MTREDIELLREKILLQCHFAARTGIPIDTIHRGCTKAGYTITLPELERELRYLEDKKFISQAQKQLSPENRRYVVTADGMDYLATQALI